MNEEQTPLVKAEHLVKIYKGRKVVDDVSITVRSGEVVGLLGPNGAGKTTSFYMVVGLIRPDGGTVSFRDVDITHLPMYKRARMGMGYLAQEPSIFRKLTVEENIIAILETLAISREQRRKRLEELHQKEQKRILAQLERERKEAEKLQQAEQEEIQTVDVNLEENIVVESEIIPTPEEEVVALETVEVEEKVLEETNLGE